jgi:glutaredoxin
MEPGKLSAPSADGRSRKRWLPLVLGVLALIALTRFLQPPDIDPVLCERDIPAETAEVVMLSAGWCRYCRRARNFLVDRGVIYCEYDIEKSRRGAELYGQSPFGAIPVIYIGDDVLVGFNSDEVAQALVAHNLLSLDDY